MIFNIHEITINPNNTIILTLCSGLFGAILGGLLSGGITFWAMKIIDNQAKERWKKDSIQKCKNDLAVDVIYLLSKLKGIANSIIYNQKQSNSCKISEDDFIDIKNLNEKYCRYHWITKDKYIIDNWDNITYYFTFFEELKKVLEREFSNQDDKEILESAKELFKKQYGVIEKKEDKFIFNIVKCANGITFYNNDIEVIKLDAEDKIINFVKTMEIKLDKILLHLLEKYKLK